MKPRLTKVWPLIHGVKGCDHSGNPLILAAGIAGWMPSSEAKDAQEKGAVQIMAGIRPSDLKKPKYDTKITTSEEAETTPVEESSKPRKRRTYKRRDLIPERPPAAE